MEASNLNDIIQHSFSPQPGIIVRYIKIPHILDIVLCMPPDPNYKILANQKFEQKNFKIPFLSSEELMKANGFKALKKQVEWLCGRFAIKNLVNEILWPDIPLPDIQISYHEKGAPFFTHYPDIPVSLSHSGDYTTVAISQNPQISLGIDIEKIGKTIPDVFFMKTAFTPEEIHNMAATAPEIYRHWTLKEAFLKYIKMGFNENLHMVEIIDNKIFHQGEKQNLNSWSRIIDDQYILSIVADPVQE
jgi:4'-phosphopantetheinyl transferase